MKRRLVCTLLLAFFLLPVCVLAQEALTNESVLKLVKAGMSEDLIVGMINSQPGTYKVGVDDVVALKQQGVSEKIIGAMVKKNGAGTSGPSTIPAEARGYPTEIGIYVKKGKEWTEVLPEVINWKTGGVLKKVATAGLVKEDVNGHIEGRRSPNSLSRPVEILIYAPEGVAITEYQLLKLRENSKSREFRTVTGGVFHSKGGATRDLLQFEGKKVAPRTFEIDLAELGPGEYGFLPPGVVTSAASSTTLGKMYTFSLVE